MTRAEFLKNFKERLNHQGIKLTEKETRVIYQAFIDTILEAVAIRGERLHLDGLGTFNIKTTKERKGRNPRTGEEILIPPDAKPIFKPSKQFKELAREWSLQAIGKTYLKEKEKLG